MIRKTLYALIDTCNNFVVIHYRAVLIILFLLTIPMAYFYSQQRHENHIGIYFDRDNEDLVYYREFQEKYGNEEFIMVVFKEPDIFTVKNMDVIRDITSSLKNIDGVQRALSLTEVKEAYGEADSISFRPVIPDNYTEDSLTGLKNRVLADRNLVNSVISPDGTTTAIFAQLQPFRDEKKRHLVNTVIDEVEKAGSGRTELHIAGVPVVEARMNILSARDYNLFVPITLLIIFILVAINLRNWTLSLLTLANMLLIFAWGIGIYCMAGQTFNMLTVILGPMLLTTAVEHSIHVLSQFEEDYIASDGRNNYADLVRMTIREVWIPCFLTSATTAMGFLSFGKATVQPVQTIGIYTAIMVLLGFIITMVFMPAALMFLQNRMHKQISWKTRNSVQAHDSGIIMHLLMKLVNFDVRHYKPISIIMTGLLLISAAIGIYKLHFETNTIQYLTEKDSTKSDIRFIEKNLGGSIPFAITIQAKTPEYDFSNPESLKLIDRAQRDLMDISNGKYTYSFSIANYFPEINRAFHENDQRYFKIPESQMDVLDFYEIGDQEVISRVVAPDRMEASINFQTTWGNNSDALNNFNSISRHMDELLGGNYTWKITGLSTLYLKMETNLMTTQISSFILSFILIFGMMFFVCRNIKLTIISMIPNIFPIFITLGIMGIFNIPFDVATIMIGSVTLGIVVDDTTHYMIWFRRNMVKGMTHKDAIVQTFKDVGKPTFITSLVLCLGFGVLMLGSIRPTQYFGILSAFAMLIAPFGDYLMLPALILIFKPKITK
ncbi:MAG TPA: MMPL family transporter [Spirochaetota bacterium]|nr:MMPL family transporter [Spirochaetota bacterium]